MRKYFFVFSNSLQSLYEYRLSLVLDILGNGIGSLIIYLFWHFLAVSGMNTAPYTVLTLGYYFLLVSTISLAIGFDTHVISQEIKDGDITPHVLKPFSYMWMKFFSTFPNALLKFFVGTLLFVFLGFLGFSIHIGWLQIIMFLTAFVLAVIGNYLIYFTVGLMAFWTQQTYGLSNFVYISSILVSGRVVPVELLPPLVAAVSSWLPFRYFLFFPAQIFLGQLSVDKIILGFGAQLFWLVFLYFLSLAVWRAGQKQLEAVGI